MSDDILSRAKKLITDGPCFHADVHAIDFARRVVELSEELDKSLRLSNSMLHASRADCIKIEKLEAENQRLREDLDNCKAVLKTQTEENAKLLFEYIKLSRKLHGWRPSYDPER